MRLYNEITNMNWATWAVSLGGLLHTLAVTWEHAEEQEVRP